MRLEVGVGILVGAVEDSVCKMMGGSLFATILAV